MVKDNGEFWIQKIWEFESQGARFDNPVRIYEMIGSLQGHVFKASVPGGRIATEEGVPYTPKRVWSDPQNL